MAGWRFRGSDVTQPEKGGLTMSDMEALQFVFAMAKDHAISEGRAKYVDPGLLEPYAKQQEAFARVETILRKLEQKEKD